MSDTLKNILWSIKKNKKAQVLLIVIAVLILLSIILAVVVATGNDEDESTNETDATNTTSNQLTGITERRLDGVEVDASVSNMLPVAIVVENLESVRPQSGLGAASIVYETLAEGGITRFMAVYATDEVADPIGPIRSARHYFVSWAEEYGGIFAHVGGSPQALGILGTTDYMTDLNQFGYSEYYYRDENLYAPHNLFSSTEYMEYALRDLELIDKTGDYEPYTFKEPAEKIDRPSDSTPITIDFSTDAYTVEWKYDRDLNAYLRFNGGEPHLDANTDDQLKATNIAVQYVEVESIGDDQGRLDIVTEGEGEAVVFMDGIAVEGSWVRSERGARTTFLDSDGNEMKFNPGTTWVEAVPNDQEVSY